MPHTLPLVLVLSLACCIQPLAAQCALDWSSGGPQPQLSGWTNCSTLWDPDGAGPEPQRLVIGGRSLQGGVLGMDQRVMTWNGTEWLSLASLGTPVAGTGVLALTSWNGLLVAGGDFTGGGTDRIALWSGASWQPLGAGFPVTVRALTVWNGNLIAAGYDASGSVDTPYIRSWNGVAWTNLPTPPMLHAPLALTSFQGWLCVGGHRTSPAVGVFERWNGTSWATSATASHRITCFASRSFSLVSWLYAGGWFNNIGGVAAPHIAVTSGGSAFTWGAVGSMPSSCIALHARSTGALAFELIASTSNPTTPNVQWNGSSWVAMGGDIEIRSFSYYAGSYHAAVVTPTGDDVCQRYSGSAWVPVKGPGIDGDVRAATRMGNDVILGGTFTTIGGAATNRIARWDGTTFQPVGGVMGGSSVDALLTLDNGDVVAGGLFLQAGPTPLNHMGRWDGSTWSAFGTGFNQQVLAICKMPNGDLIAGGKFTTAGGIPSARIARWNGSAWSNLGTGMNGDVQALAARSDGVLFAGGLFTTAGGVSCSHIAQWNGTAWLNVGAGCNGDVLGLVVRPNDDVVAVGAFTSAGGLPADRCARWIGNAWASMGTAPSDGQPVRAALLLPNGDLVVGHGFHTANNPDEGLSRWDGSVWTGLGTLGAHQPGYPATVRALAQAGDGDLVVGGTFSVADGTISRNLTKVESTCMPLVSPYGAGCSSAAGPLVITADTLPWIGTSFRTTTTGIAPLSLCIGVIGLSQVSIPLDLLLAEGQPGCTLLAALDILLFLQNGPGTAHSAFALEADPSLIGVTFYQQTAPLEFDAGGAIVAIRSSNALAATIGTL